MPLIGAVAALTRRVSCPPIAIKRRERSPSGPPTSPSIHHELLVANGSAAAVRRRVLEPRRATPAARSKSARSTPRRERHLANCTARTCGCYATEVGAPLRAGANNASAGGGAVDPVVWPTIGWASGSGASSAGVGRQPLCDHGANTRTSIAVTGGRSSRGSCRPLLSVDARRRRPSARAAAAAGVCFAAAARAERLGAARTATRKSSDPPRRRGCLPVVEPVATTSRSRGGRRQRRAAPGGRRRAPSVGRWPAPTSRMGRVVGGRAVRRRPAAAALERVVLVGGGRGEGRHGAARERGRPATRPVHATGVALGVPSRARGLGRVHAASPRVPSCGGVVEGRRWAAAASSRARRTMLSRVRCVRDRPRRPVCSALVGKSMVEPFIATPLYQALLADAGVRRHGETPRRRSRLDAVEEAEWIKAQGDWETTRRRWPQPSRIDDDYRRRSTRRRGASCWDLAWEKEVAATRLWRARRRCVRQRGRGRLRRVRRRAGSWRAQTARRDAGRHRLRPASATRRLADASSWARSIVGPDLSPQGVWRSTRRLRRWRAGRPPGDGDAAPLAGTARHRREDCAATRLADVSADAVSLAVIHELPPSATRACSPALRVLAGGRRVTEMDAAGAPATPSCARVRCARRGVLRAVPRRVRCDYQPSLPADLVDIVLGVRSCTCATRSITATMSRCAGSPSRAHRSPPRRSRPFIFCDRSSVEAVESRLERARTCARRRGAPCST